MSFTDNYKNCFKCSNYSGNSYVKYLPQTDNNSFDNIYKKNSIEQFLKKIHRMMSKKSKEHCQKSPKTDVKKDPQNVRKIFHKQTNRKTYS